MQTIIKAAVSLLLIAFLVFRIEWTNVWVHLEEISVWLIIVCIGMQIVAYVIGAWRWALLLALHRLGHRAKELIRIYLIGALFNNLLPSATGGDLLRAYYIYKQKHGLAIAVSPIFTERVIGLVTLIGLAALAVRIVDTDHPITDTFKTLLPYLFVMSVLCLVLIGHRKVYRPVHRFFERWRHIRIVQAILQIAEANHQYLNQPRVLTMLVLLSLLLQGVEILLFSLLGYGVGADLEIWHYMVVVPLLFVAASLPITIGGLGVREAAAITLFGLHGMAEEQAATVMVLFLVILLSTSLPGLYYFLRMKGHKDFLAEASHTKGLPL